jgi:hypothetical protein
MFTIVIFILIGLLILHFTRQEGFVSDVPLNSVLRLDEVKQLEQASRKRTNNTTQELNIALTDSLKSQQNF